MDFLKTVLSGTSPPSSPSSSPPDSDPEDSASSWTFGSSLMQSIASKSESLLGNYYRDIQEFTSGLKDESLVIREAASRALRYFPARLDSGAAIAQESLEAVGQSIDIVAELIGKEMNLARGNGYSRSGGDAKLNVIGRPYSRLEAVISGLQGDASTYCDEIDDSSSFSDWKLEFRIEGKSEEIDRLLKENGVIREIHDEIVPQRVDDQTFWCRYFYRVEMAVKAEETRASIVKRAISGDADEDFSWDFDDDTEPADGGNVDSPTEAAEEEKEALKSQMKADPQADEVNPGGRSSCSEKEGSDGKLGSDISIIWSQKTPHAEDDMGWDEIEHIPSGEQNKPESHRKSAQEDEGLTHWGGG